MIGQSERTDILAMRWSIDALRVEVRMLQLRLALRRYDPSQPRMPAGTGEGGNGTVLLRPACAWRRIRRAIRALAVPSARCGQRHRRCS